MTIAEKIAHLRLVNDISQEKFASILGVSRQTISKWESGESLPQIDNVKEICELFKVTADELLNDEVVIHRGKKVPLSIGEDIKTKYFGTDGFRGEVNKVLTADHAYKIGRFLGWFYSNPKYNCQAPGYRARVVIGKDTRRSSYMLEYAVAAGLAASGADVELLHVTTTPSVSYIVRQACRRPPGFWLPCRLPHAHDGAQSSRSRCFRPPRHGRSSAHTGSPGHRRGHR